eukprot:g15611.t1
MASFLNGPTLSSRSFEIFENDKGDEFACEGWLLIKKQSKSGWKKRYCKIYKDEKTLSLYDGKSIFLEPKLQLKLDDSIECKTIIGQKLNKENCFTLTNASKDVVVASAFDEVDQEVCVSFILNIVDKSDAQSKSSAENAQSKLHTSYPVSITPRSKYPCSWQLPTPDDMSLFGEQAVNDSKNEKRNRTYPSLPSDRHHIESLDDIYFAKSFDVDLYIQKAFKELRKDELHALLSNLEHDKDIVRKNIKELVVKKFKDIIHVDIEGHDFIQRSDPRTETGRLSKNSSPRAFSSIANEEVSADKESKSIELDNFSNDHKQYSKLISRLGSLLDDDNTDQHE